MFNNYVTVHYRLSMSFWMRMAGLPQFLGTHMPQMLVYNRLAVDGLPGIINESDGNQGGPPKAQIFLLFFACWILLLRSDDFFSGEQQRADWQLGDVRSGNARGTKTEGALACQLICRVWLDVLHLIWFLGLHIDIQKNYPHGSTWWCRWTWSCWDEAFAIAVVQLWGPTIPFP